MTPTHHPSDLSLMRYAAGSMPIGMRLVASVHIASCPHCAQAVLSFEAVGGALLDDMEPATMAPDALAKALAALDTAPTAAAAVAPRRSDDFFAPGVPIPDALRHCQISGWRWAGAGLKVRNIRIPEAPTERIVLAWFKAGRPMPAHGHTGTEFTLSISGSFSDRGKRYGAGDIEEADTETEHQPIVDKEQDCFCLTAVEGKMLLRSSFARLAGAILRV